MGAMEDERDSVDRHIAGFLRRYPEIDADVEGIVDRVCKLHKYFVNTLEDTIAGYGLVHAEYKLLLHLRAEGSEHGRVGRRSLPVDGHVVGRDDQPARPPGDGRAHPPGKRPLRPPHRAGHRSPPRAAR